MSNTDGQHCTLARYNSCDSMWDVVASALGPANGCSEAYQGFPSISPYTRHNKHIPSNSLRNLPLAKTVWASNQPTNSFESESFVRSQFLSQSINSPHFTEEESSLYHEVRIRHLSCPEPDESSLSSVILLF